MDALVILHTFPLTVSSPQIEKWEGVAEMPEVWWSCETEWDLLERVAMLKQWILARPEQTIAIVRPRQDFAAA